MMYFIIIILLLLIILYIIYKDYLKVLKINSIITGVSGILTFIIGYTIKIFIGRKIDFININKVTNLVLSKFIKNSIYLLIISLIEVIIFLIISYYLKNKKLEQI